MLTAWNGLHVMADEDRLKSNHVQVLLLSWGNRRGISSECAHSMTTVSGYAAQVARPRSYRPRQRPGSKRGFPRLVRDINCVERLVAQPKPISGQPISDKAAQRGSLWVRPFVAVDLLSVTHPRRFVAEPRACHASVLRVAPFSCGIESLQFGVIFVKDTI